MNEKPRFVLRECQKHGLTEYRLDGKSYRCKQCNVVNVTKRRRGVKQSLVEEFGGACSLCGYCKCLNALQFHHLNPAEKSFGLSSKGNTLSIDRLREEAQKCILVCSNCHAEIEAGVTLIFR